MFDDGVGVDVLELEGVLLHFTKKLAVIVDLLGNLKFPVHFEKSLIIIIMFAILNLFSLVQAID